MAFLLHDWPTFAHGHQMPPPGAWSLWLLMGGRGAGKTRAGAEWIRARALGHRWCEAAVAGRIALVGETFADVREVMIEGVSGLLAVHPRHERPAWNPSRRRLEWPNGAVAQAFSAEDPEALRGPQFDIAWSDELAKWRHAEETFDMLQFGLRLGARPRQLVTTTPRPVPLLKRLIDLPGTALTHAPTRANALFLAPGFLERIVARYQGTRLGRQELDGELIEDRPDALWRRDALEACRVDRAPDALVRIVVAVDPPATATRRSDGCGLIVAGLGADGVAYVLADRSRRPARPADWAGAAVALWHHYRADCLVAEVNQGGDMVRAVIAGIDPAVPVRCVRATRGKLLRAEPVAMLYDQGRVRHVGALPELEDEMADFGPGGLSSGRSPDRLDALVWALSELMPAGRGEPRLRRL
ncbi:DNA-packaging protein [Polymorphum gilvum]|uniref:Phage DNA Packaging Protein n=1 Tax=Polymorphum gilvum (strain LMG 25793 / CGMCC 1.9160 / SL003B-26A1) TaxID=991905 RepID=F2IV24_POLGS|nr:terminase family protein [Polymorphum gilvum]ADZ71355.1 Phage DNA Packaging Protein [Polymorphum gilvum SL003B-26A1]